VVLEAIQPKLPPKALEAIVFFVRRFTDRICKGANSFAVGANYSGVDRNYGGVDRNYGGVGGNYGAVDRNYSGVGGNYGAVGNKEGSGASGAIVGAVATCVAIFSKHFPEATTSSPTPQF